MEHGGTRESSEEVLDAGARLQHQHREMLQRNERDLARPGPIQGELTPMEGTHIPPTHTSSAPPSPSAAVRGFLPLSIALGTGGGWQREAAQL